MKQWRYKMGCWLARRGYVRRAIEEKADLAAFRKPPTMGIIAGIFLICFSFLIAWPAISVLGAVVLYYHLHPWIVVIGGPALYGLSHLCFIVGMIMAGGIKYPHIFLRWATRAGVEKLLAAKAE